MKLRAFSSIAFVSLATCGAFAACSSFSTTPSEPDASVTPDASPSGADATPDSAPDGPPQPRDAGAPEVFVADAAYACRTVIADTFTNKTANTAWLPAKTPGTGEADLTNDTASMTLPAGMDSYTVLASPPFFEKAPPPATEPDLVTIDFTVAVPSVQPMGVTIAQLPSLTANGNVRLAATPRAPGSNGSSLSLVSPSGDTAGSFELNPGETAILRWSYTRAGEGVSVTLERFDMGPPTPTLALSGKLAPDASASYFQMGPFSNLGATMGARIIYDYVTVQACTKRP